MSLRGDVVQKGESSKDIIAESLSYFMQNGARECNIMPLANELNQVTQIIQSGMSITKFAQIFSSRKPDCTILQRKIYRIKILQKK